jgi:hypothetical protein
MEPIPALDGVSRADLKAFNRCRLFLGVMFLSEIITANGMAISWDAWTGTHARFPCCYGRISHLLVQNLGVFGEDFLPMPSLKQLLKELLRRLTIFTCSLHWGRGSRDPTGSFTSGNTRTPLPRARSTTRTSITILCTLVGAAVNITVNFSHLNPTTQPPVALTTASQLRNCPPLRLCLPSVE